MYPTTALQPSQTYNPEVVKLQQWLVSNGFMSQADMNSGSGYYGPKTVAAVTAFQRAAGINTSGNDGYWGPLSISKASSWKTPSTSTPTSTSSTQQPATSSSSSWNLSNWQSRGNSWVIQPVLTIDGREYRFSTPQEYINAMQGLTGGNIQTFIGQFQSVVPNFSTTQTTPTSIPTTPTTISTPSTQQMTRDQKISALAKIMDNELRHGINLTTMYATHVIDKFPNATMEQLSTFKKTDYDLYKWVTSDFEKRISSPATSTSTTPTSTTTPTTTKPTTTPTSTTPTSTTPTSTTPTPTSTTGYPKVSLQPGMNSPEVKKLQEWLISIGYKIPDGATGYFGSQTKAAVEQFQQDNKIDTQGNYGYWGPITMGVVNTGNYVYPNKTGYTPSGQQNSDSGTNSGSPSGTDGSSTSGSSADSGTETFNPYYGDTKDQGLEQAANTALRGIFSAGGATGVSSSYVDQVRNNQELVAFYIIAMAYGDYTPSDIIKDMKRRELVASGQKQYEDVTIISGELDRGQYLATNDGSAAMNLPVFKDIKVVFGDLDPSIFDLPIFSPGFDQAFKKLVPILDPDSPEFKAEKDKIKAVFYDVIEQQNNAQLEQQKAVADYTYGRLVDYLQKTYGITLSNNAQEAWKQIEGIGTNYAAANIYGSGLQAEAIDDTLKFRKKADQVIRDKFSSDKEESQYKHYRDNASPEDIKRIIDEDIAKGLPKSQWRATKWGLIPSEEILSKLSVDALMANDPKLTREMAERYRSSIIDENGNYRSNIFQSAFAKNYGLDPNSVYNQRDQYKANKVMEQSLVNEQKAYAPYSSIISQVAGSNTGGSAAIRPAASENSGAAVTDSRNNPSGTSTTQQTYGTTNGTTWINKDQTVGYADKSTADLIKSASGMSANLATPNPTSTTPTTQTPTYTTPNLNYGQTNPTNTNVQYVTANDYAFKPGETLQQWQQRVSNYRIK